MTAPDRRSLAGIVEVDETTLPLRGKDEPLTGGGGRSRQGKMLLAGAIEVKGNGPGRIRLAKIENFSAAPLHDFVAANVAQGGTIKTDGWTAYLCAPGVDRLPRVVGAMAAHVVLPRIHRVFSNLKARALGVYHGLRDKHLQSFLDEFILCFNRRRSRHAVFRSLFSIASAAKPVTYKMLIEPDFAE